MNILGVSAHYHDSAACLVRDGRIAGAAHEEWFSRRKHDPSFPVRAAHWCLESSGLDWADVDCFAYYELPHLKRRRVEATLKGAPPSVRGRALRRLAGRGPADVGGMFPAANPRAFVLAVEHHLAHAASAFFPSPFEHAAVVTVDGVGELTTTSVSVGRDNRLTPLHRQVFPHSLGLFYSALTAYCGFRVNSGEYKLMGLAPYGTPRYASLLRERVIRVAGDGAFRLNMDYFAFLDPDSGRLASDRLAELLGRPARRPEDELDEFHADVAASTQAVFEDAMVGIARFARERTGARYLCLAGGGALNCVANSRIVDSGTFDDVWVQPAASDAGGALGAALYAWHQHQGRPRMAGGDDAMRGALLGPAFEPIAVHRYLDSIAARYVRMREPELVESTAARLAEGRTVAWFQGRQEFGPRALGSRSILADPRSAAMQRHLNLAVKNRESFRPFAPAVTAEDAPAYFDVRRSSPYMLFTAPVREDLRRPVDVDADAERTADGRFAGRASQVRSVIPAVTHVDHSARLQTVDRRTHPLFWSLIRAFGDRTGTPVLVNTSFNVRGEPIVCTPADAVRTFMRSGLDYLCLGDAVLDRRNQAGIEVELLPLPDTD